MKKSKKKENTGMTRRDALKVSGLGLALGGFTMAGGGASNAIAASSGSPQGVGLSEKNSYLTRLKPYIPGTENPGEDEMRITFMGSWFNPRIAQACNSVFVEVGPGSSGTAPDQVIFDCGSGVVARYYAMGIPLSRMDKIFLTHIHADHMSDLTYVYCFGPSMDRKWPLCVWGPSKSDFTWESPDGTESYGPYEDDGTAAYCGLLRQAARWHTESFSFQTTARTTPPYNLDNWGIEPTEIFSGGYAAGDDRNEIDAYALYAFELDWQVEEGGTAYENSDTGVKITYFPAIHTRRGAISYKLEWQGLSMIFTGDTKANYYVVDQARDGVDVLIHEMTPPPDVWTEKFTGLTPDDPRYKGAYDDLANVQNSSHTEQKMFGYVLGLIKDGGPGPNGTTYPKGKAPRLAVGTHFPASDDTIRSAIEDIRSYYPKGEVAVATDFMVLNVTKKTIQQRGAVVPDYVWTPPTDPDAGSQIYYTPKYWTWGTNDDGSTNYDEKVGDPYAQIDVSQAIPKPADYDER